MCGVRSFARTFRLWRLIHELLKYTALMNQKASFYTLRLLPPACMTLNYAVYTEDTCGEWDTMSILLFHQNCLV